MCKVKVLEGEYAQELVRSHEALSNEELENRLHWPVVCSPNSDLEIITIEDYEKMNINNETAKLAGSK